VSIYEGGRSLLFHTSGQERCNARIEGFNSNLKSSICCLNAAPNYFKILSILLHYNFQNYQNSSKNIGIFSETVEQFAAYYIWLFSIQIDHISNFRLIKNSKKLFTFSNLPGLIKLQLVFCE